jgi:hypothetical protein
MTELGQQTGQVAPELASGGVIRLTNRKQRRVVGYIVPLELCPPEVKAGEELLGQPRRQRTRDGRSYTGFQHEIVTTGDLAALPAARAARVLGLPERTVARWRATLNGAVTA